MTCDNLKIYLVNNKDKAAYITGIARVIIASSESVVHEKMKADDCDLSDYTVDVFDIDDGIEIIAGGYDSTDVSVN